MVLLGVVLVLDVFSLVEVFIGRFVGVNDGFIKIGFVGRGEGVSLEINEDVDDEYTVVISIVVVGMILEKEEKIDVWLFVVLIFLLEGIRVEKREDFVKMGVVRKVVKSEVEWVLVV